MRQTSRPERTRSLPNGDLDLRDVDLSSNVPVEFLRGGGLKEKGQGFRQVRACFGNGVSLACDIYFGAQGDISNRRACQKSRVWDGGYGKTESVEHRIV